MNNTNLTLTENRELTTGMDALDTVSDFNGGHIYYAREISGWISVSTDAVEEFGAALIANVPDAYSLWCATYGEEFISDAQIEALRGESAQFGDDEMIEICDGALRGLASAVVRCEEVIADALAQVGT